MVGMAKEEVRPAEPRLGVGQFALHVQAHADWRESPLGDETHRHVLKVRDARPFDWLYLCTRASGSVNGYCRLPNWAGYPHSAQGHSETRAQMQ